MAIVTKRFEMTSPGGFALTKTALPSAVVVGEFPGAVCEIQFDDAIPGSDDTLVQWMRMFGWVENAAATAPAKVGAVNAFSRAQYTSPVALVDGANIPLDASLSNLFTVTLGGNRTLSNPTNVVAGMSWAVLVAQGAGGNSLAFGANYKWGTEGAPDLTTSGAGVIDIITCVAISATRIACTTLRGFAT